MTLMSVRQPSDSPVPRRPRPLPEPKEEPGWAVVTKWCLLAAAVLLTSVTVVELIRTVKTLAEVPVNIVTTLPPLPDPQTNISSGPNTTATVSEDVGSLGASGDSGSKNDSELLKPKTGPTSDLPGQKLTTTEVKTPEPEQNFSSTELAQIRKLLERASSSKRQREQPASPQSQSTPASSPQLLSGIQRTTAESREQQRRSAASRRREALRVSSGPKVTLIGADALVETELENRSEELQKRTVVLELRVNGRRRQQRKVRIRLAPRSKVHLSERFSTTLPDGTYSAAVLLDPLG